MPIGHANPNRSTNFVSTVINNNGTAPNNTARGTAISSTARASRRTVGNGSWIVSELQQAQQQIHQALQGGLDGPITTSPSTATASPSSSNYFFVHPRQSSFAEMEYSSSDPSTATSRTSTISPRQVQEAGSPNDRLSEELIESYLNDELETSIRNNNSYDSVVGAPSGYEPNPLIRFELSDSLQSQIASPNVPYQLQQVIRNAASLHNSVGMSVRNMAASAAAATNNSQIRPVSNPPNNNSALRNKIVYRLNCAYCSIAVCDRAMRAILLADTKIELYSTDIPPRPLRTMDEDRLTQGCNCRIRDTVCSGCGNVIGYHVSQPCERCLDARNNGHFWMFYSEGVVSNERKQVDGNGPLFWAALTPMCEFIPASACIRPEQASNSSGYDSFCR